MSHFNIFGFKCIKIISLEESLLGTGKSKGRRNEDLKMGSKIQIKETSSDIVR